MEISDSDSICAQITNIPEFDPVWVGLNHDFDYYLAFELEPPWNKKVELGDNFPKTWNESLVSLKNAGKKIKFLAVKPRETQNNTVKLFIYKNPKREYITLKPLIFDLPREYVPKLISDLETENLESYSKFLEQTKYRDIFVCIHANRDQCCGKLGHSLVGSIRNQIGWSLSIRVWECSHLGGHRMAPTMLDMPAGNLWGFVSEDDVKNILNYSGNHEFVLKKFRGSMGSNKIAQIAEKELFFFWGWQWFRMKRKVGHVEDMGSKYKVTIEFDAYNTINKAEIIIEEDGVLFFPPNQCDDGKEIKKYFVKSMNFVK